MKLDSECTRDILIIVQEHSNYGTKVIYPDHMISLRNKWRDMQIRYHIKQANEAGLLKLTKIDDLNRMYIADLTPAGHEYINNMYSENLWSKMKRLLSKTGSESLTQAIRLGISIAYEALIKLFP